MKRYIGIVERVDIVENTCKVRIPNLDGFDAATCNQIGMSMLQITSTEVDFLRSVDIPLHLQGIRVGDIVYCLDAESPNDNFQMVGFFGGTR